MSPRPSRFEEEKLPSKLNFSVWGKILRYSMRYWPLLLGGLFCMMAITFYDSSFIPVMNAGAIAAAEDSAFFAHQSIWEVTIPVTFIFHIKVNMSFLAFAISLGAMALIRSFMIFLNFYLTNLVSMHVMLDL